MPDFETRNLRVQFPCGPVTIIPCRLGSGCYGAGWWFSCRAFSSCPWNSGYCPFNTSWCRGFQTLIAYEPGGACGASDQPIEQGTIHVAVEDLADLREMLEEQLKEVKAAEAEVAKRQSK